MPDYTLFDKFMIRVPLLKYQFIHLPNYVFSKEFPVEKNLIRQSGIKYISKKNKIYQMLDNKITIFTLLINFKNARIPDDLKQITLKLPDIQAK
jgi:hypothetical protein